MAPPARETRRLAYVGDVPVSGSSGGMLLLCRLLECVPEGQLLIHESVPSPASQRLPGAEYRRFSKWLGRLRNTRYHALFNTCAIAMRALHARKIVSELRGRNVHAILAISHGTSWLVADQVADSLGVPLVLINHDYWPDTCRTLVPSRFVDELFGRVYRRAALRYCISPQMEEYYRGAYNAAGQVLYPYRAAAATWATAPPPPVQRPLTVAYAGTVSSRAHRDALGAMAQALEQVGGKLLLYSNLSQTAAWGLPGASRSVETRDFVPSSELVDRLREEADALFLPLTSGMGMNARLSFPSKLADYCAAALPIIVLGAPDSSAYAWADANRAAAMPVREGDRAALMDSIKRLAADRELRVSMGEAALSIGREFFDGKRAQAAVMGAVWALTGADTAH